MTLFLRLIAVAQFLVMQSRAFLWSPARHGIKNPSGHWRVLRLLGSAPLTQPQQRCPKPKEWWSPSDLMLFMQSPFSSWMVGCREGLPWLLRDSHCPPRRRWHPTHADSAQPYPPKALSLQPCTETRFATS